MALPEQIDRAARAERKLVGFGFMNRDAVLARPPGERQAAVEEILRGRRIVHRFTARHECAWVCRNEDHEHYGPLKAPLCADTVCARIGYPAGTTDAEELLAILDLTEPGNVDMPQAERPCPADQPVEKRCGRCKETKPASAFHPDPRYKSGLSSRCRDCHRELNTEIQRRRRTRQKAGTANDA